MSQLYIPLELMPTCTLGKRRRTIVAVQSEFLLLDVISEGILLTVRAAIVSPPFEL